MNTQKQVFKKLFKEDLENHKIALKNIDNLKRIISDGKSIYDRGIDFINKKTSLQKEAKVLNKDAKGLLIGGEKLLDEFIKSAKDLGIDINSIKEVEQARNTLGVLDTVLAQSKEF